MSAFFTAAHCASLKGEGFIKLLCNCCERARKRERERQREREKERLDHCYEVNPLPIMNIMGSTSAVTTCTCVAA